LLQCISTTVVLIIVIIISSIIILSAPSSPDDCQYCKPQTETLDVLRSANMPRNWEPLRIPEFLVEEDSTPSDSEISTTSLWEGQVGEVSQIASWYVPATSQLRRDVPRHPFFAPKRWRWLAAGTLLPPPSRRQGATSAA